MVVSLLHCAASMASGVPRKPGWSWKGGEKGQKGLVTDSRGGAAAGGNAGN